MKMFFCTLSIALLSSACASQDVVGPRAQNNMNQSGAATGKDLPNLVKTFAEDVGPNGQAAWKELQSFPRAELIDSLSKSQSSVSNDDPQRYAIAFTLANLDYKYQDNVRILTSALTATPKPNEHADTVTMMLGRLISRGDKDLLKVLFSISVSADASLGEALSETFANELRNSGREFLAKLNHESIATRTSVYKRLDSGSLTADDIKTIRIQLQSWSRDKSVSRVANEMLSAPPFK